MTAAAHPMIVGWCPMGCGTTLFVGSGGHITCSFLGCPRPTAVDELLEERETEHLVQLGETSFTVQHPLRERLDADLWTCDVHRKIEELDGPPRQPGRYRVIVRPGTPWAWMPTAPGGDS